MRINKTNSLAYLDKSFPATLTWQLFPSLFHVHKIAIINIRQDLQRLIMVNFFCCCF